MTALETEHTREKWRRKRFPDECKRIDLLEKDAEHLMRGGTLLISYQLKCSDPAIVAAAKASSDAAQKAIAAAGAVVSPSTPIASCDDRAPISNRSMPQ